MRADTSTTTSASTLNLSDLRITYTANPALLQAIRKVLRKAARWRSKCCGQTDTGPRRHCENYGCASIVELLEPLKQFKAERKRRVK